MAESLREEIEQRMMRIVGNSWAAYETDILLNLIIKRVDEIENPFTERLEVFNAQGDYHHTENDDAHIGFNEAIQAVKEKLGLETLNT